MTSEASRTGTAEMRLAPFLLLTLALPAAIVVGNSAIGILTPTTIWIQDEVSIFDAVWRVVQGQHLGTDFHFVLGFGISELAAALWRLMGPHYYVLRAAVALYALLIVGCASIVATRQLRKSAGLAALFCSTIAFVASGPL